MEQDFIVESPNTKATPELSFHDVDPTIKRRIQQHRITKLGVVRVLSTITMIEWIFVVATTVGVACTAGFAIYFISQNPINKTDELLAIIVLIHAFFCLLYVLNGVMAERLPEMLVIIVTTVILMIYSTVNYAFRELPQDIKLARLITAWCLGVPVIGLAIYVAYLVNKNCMIFHIIGTNAPLVSMVKRTFVYHSLLKFNLQTCLTLLVSVMHVYARGVPLRPGDIATIVLSVIFIFSWTAAGYCAVRFENKILLGVFAVASSILIVGFLIWKAIEIDFAAHGTTYLAIFCLSAIITTLNHVLLMIISPFISSTFGKGIKQLLYDGLSPDDVFFRQRHICGTMPQDGARVSNQGY